MTHRTPRSIRHTLAAPLLAVGLLAAACGGGGDDASDTTAPAASGTVRLLTYSSFAMPDEAKAAFEERTGLTLEVIAQGDAGETLNRALLTSGAPEADVLFGVDNTLMGRALASDAFEATDPEGLDRVPAEFRLDDSGRLHPVDRGDVCVNADAAWYEEAGIPVPTGLDDLIDPRYRDHLAVQDPASSSPGLAFLLATVARYGEDGFEEFWGSLEANGVRVVGSWDTAYFEEYTVSGGDRPLVVSYASSPPAEVVYSEGELTEPASVVLEETCFAQVEFAGLLAGAANPEGGRRLIEFLLSDTWQEALPLANFVFPVVEGVTLPEVFEEFASVPETPYTLAPAAIEEGRDGWISRWRRLFG